ncbi:MAG: hypothetical protein OXG19_06860 [Chloroflexi bacterium]|nr:hypothetical protein [Chloroflexota bacterium]
MAALAAAAASGWTAVAAHGPGSDANSDQSPSSAPVVQLFAGWNHVPYMGLTLPLPDALNDARPHVTTVWQYDAAIQKWHHWREGLPPQVASLAQLERGGVYFVFATQGALWTQPLAPPSSSPEPGSRPGAWEVVFTRSVDALGLSQTARFDATGSGAMSQAGGAEHAFTADSTALATVDRLLRDNDFYRSWPGSAVTGCPGCSLWEITIRDPNGGQIALQADDFGLSGALFTLVEELYAILLAAVGW